jgi:dihydroorotate dehydrogenase (fumarate)
MDLSTSYLGLKLKNPVVASASPLTAELDSIKKLADAGVGAITLHSLFEEQLAHEQSELDYLATQGGEAYAEHGGSWFPEPDEYRNGPEEYLKMIQDAKAAVDVPVIASLNGVTVGGWTDIGKQMQQAGADALELNVYYIATDPNLTAAEVERRYVDILKAVKSAVTIPVAMKLSPYFSATTAMARQLDAAGADGLVLFNRFYQPDIDLDALEVKPDLVLSAPHELRLPLRWIAILYDQVDASLAATSGVASGADVIKAMMAGADIAQVCSVLLRHGPEHAAVLVRQVQEWMTEKEYESIEQMKGSMSQRACPDPAAFERANYMKTLNSYT